MFGGYERYAVHQRRQGYEHIPRFIRRGLMLRLSRLLPESARGKNFLRNIALDSGDRYLDSISYFTEDAKRELLSAGIRTCLESVTRQPHSKTFSPSRILRIPWIICCTSIRKPICLETF